MLTKSFVSLCDQSTGNFAYSELSLMMTMMMIMMVLVMMMIMVVVLQIIFVKVQSW